MPFNSFRRSVAHSFHAYYLPALLALLLLGVNGNQRLTAQDIGATPASLRRLVLDRTQYRLRAGETIPIDLSKEALSLVAGSRRRQSKTLEGLPHGISVGFDQEQHQLFLAAPLTMTPGDSQMIISAAGEQGEEWQAQISVTVDPIRPVTSMVLPAVILLNGFQSPSLLRLDSCPAQPVRETFGNLPSYLGQGFYFFDNCTECKNCAIEILGQRLGQVISTLKYSDGSPVSQVDLVAHSMGGLIARSYLSGKQTASGVFNPPIDPKVRKLIMIGTPNFGSSIAANLGLQSSAMVPASQFLWDLSTWNQGSDDLRGVDTLAVVGNTGDGGRSDGIVSISSASLHFASSDERTRIVPYCHTLSTLCSSTQSIATITDPTHLTFQIINSFLNDTAGWKSTGTSPNQDPYWGITGGVTVALKNSDDSYANDISSFWIDNTTSGVISNTNNSFAKLYSSEFLTIGAHDLVWYRPGGTASGTVSVSGGGTAPYLFKFGPIINSVSSPSSGGPGRIFTSGSTITVNGTGLSSQTGTTRLYANNVALPILSQTDTQITAPLSSSYSGLVRITVQNGQGQHSVNALFISPSALPVPVLSVTPAQLAFSYRIIDPSPPSQSLIVTNTGTGTLTWGAATSASWLSVSPTSGTAPSTLSVSVNPSGITAPGTYAGIVAVANGGGSSRTIAVNLTVTANQASSLLVSPASLSFSYQMNATGSGPLPQVLSVTSSAAPLAFTVTIQNGGGWLSVNPLNATTPNTLLVAVNPAGLPAGTYTGTIVLASPTSANRTQAIPVTFTVTAQPSLPSMLVSPGLLSFAYQAGGASPPSQAFSIKSNGVPFVFQANVIEIAGGNWLSVNPPAGTTPSNPTVTVNTVGLAPGAYAAKIRVASGQVLNSPLDITVQIVVNPPKTKPVIASVLNGASFQPGIASGSWITIQGSNLSLTTRTWDSARDFRDGLLPTSLDGVSVSINGKAAPVYFISPGQINALAPDDATVGPVLVAVTTSDGVSETFNAQKQSIAAAFFRFDPQNRKYLAAITPDGSFVGPTGLFGSSVTTRPVKPGDIILFYGTGFGPTDPPIPTARAFSGAARLVNSVVITIGGVPASVTFAGLTSSGLYQFNVIIPESVLGGDQEVIVMTGGSTSQPGAFLSVEQ